MLCISTVSARATGEIKSTWLGDVAMIPWRGEEWEKRKERMKIIKSRWGKAKTN